ncbi:hypothetical protein [Legionella shakespearei]|nr:hypothetical protein [Legionella shakespearei]
MNEFLLVHSGTTAQAIAKLISDDPEKFGPVFFQPYTSTGNFFKRAAYVASAPIFLSIFTAELMISSLIIALDAVFNLIKMDTKTAKSRGEDLLICTLFTVGAGLAALASPFINAVDLVGSLFAKSTDEQQEEARSEYAPS